MKSLPLLGAAALALAACAHPEAPANDPSTQGAAPPSAAMPGGNSAASTSTSPTPPSSVAPAPPMTTPPPAANPAVPGGDAGSGAASRPARARRAALTTRHALGGSVHGAEPPTTRDTASSAPSCALARRGHALGLRIVVVAPRARRADEDARRGGLVDARATPGAGRRLGLLG